MMQFIFEIPFKFERIFNFTNPELSLNYYWFDTKNIERFEPNIKQTLVKSLKISSLFKGDRQDTERYLVTLTRVTGSNDVFYIPIKLLPKFLERFDLI